MSVSHLDIREVVSFLGDSPLLPGENPSEYQSLQRAISQALRPKDIFEEVWAAEIASQVWEIVRYRKMMASLVRTKEREALETVLRPHSFRQDTSAS